MSNLDELVAATRAEDRRERLASLLPGGAPQRPYLVASASVIEQHATRSMPCPQCGGQFRVLEHEREFAAGQPVRRLDVRCRQCGRERALWFAIAPIPDEPN